MLSGVIERAQANRTSSNGTTKVITKQTSVGDAPASDQGEAVVQVTITDEAGNVIEENDELGEEMECLLSSKKRVRMPSSILSELYPTLPSPYYK